MAKTTTKSKPAKKTSAKKTTAKKLRDMPAKRNPTGGKSIPMEKAEK
jgi:hypothetical protein